MKVIVQVMVLLLLSQNVAQAKEIRNDKVLEKLSHMKYMKSYKELQPAQKEKIIQHHEKRERIYALATKAGIQKSDVYKEYMLIVRKESAMRIFLQKHREGIKVSEPEIKEYYKNNIRNYTAVHAYTIVRNNKEGEKDIQSYIKQLEQTPKEKQFALFQKLAKKYSLHPKKSLGGDMGFVGYRTIIQPFGKEAFALKDGTFTHKPFHTALGWHVVYVKERKITPLEKVKASIEVTLRGEKYREWFEKL